MAATEVVDAKVTEGHTGARQDKEPIEHHDRDEE